MTAKSRLGSDPLSWIKNTAERETPSGARLSDVEYVPVLSLKPNSLNTEFFLTESDEYFERLSNDIRERGIIVPLIAKQDGTLLAGHNRLEVARKIGIKVVPVQYVLDDLSPEKEREFVVKDNLFRRHLSSADWIGVYKLLYPNFEEKIREERRGRKKDDDIPENTLTFEKIAQDTGQTREAVKKQIRRYLNTSESSSEKENFPKKSAKHYADPSLAERINNAVKMLGAGNVKEAVQLLENITAELRAELAKT